MENVTHTAKFITVEGGEGVGKTTQLRLIEARLREAGIPLLVTREPGGTELGEQLRQLLLQKEILFFLFDIELRTLSFRTPMPDQQ